MISNLILITAGVVFAVCGIICTRCDNKAARLQRQYAELDSQPGDPTLRAYQLHDLAHIEDKINFYHLHANIWFTRCMISLFIFILAWSLLPF